MVRNTNVITEDVPIVICKSTADLTKSTNSSYFLYINKCIAKTKSADVRNVFRIFLGCIYESEYYNENINYCEPR